jgi:hypothetical protein
MRLLHQLVEAASPIQQGIFRVEMEMNKIRMRHEQYLTAETPPRKTTLLTRYLLWSETPPAKRLELRFLSIRMFDDSVLTYGNEDSRSRIEASGACHGSQSSVMKKHVLLGIALAFSILHSVQAATNSLAIYLVHSGKVFPQWQTGTMPKPAELELAPSPVLADSDFVSFDPAAGFEITIEAAKRLAGQIGALGVSSPSAFVLKANDEPIYVGAFYTPLSSRAFAGPVFIPHVLFIPPNSTNAISFFIQPGYPGEFPGIAKQLRDPRVVMAAHQLFHARNKNLPRTGD